MIDLLTAIEECDNLLTWWANDDEYAFDCWERMTLGGVNGAHAVSYWEWTWTQRCYAYQRWMHALR